MIILYMYFMADNENMDLNRFLKKIEETVKENGYISVDITGHANNEKDDPKTIYGTYLNLRTYQNSDDFDFSKAEDSLFSTHGDAVRVRLRYKEENIEYTVDIPLKEVPNHFNKLRDSGVKGLIKKEPLNFKKSWSYDGAVVANKLPVSNVSQIPSGILVEPETGKILWSKLSNKPMEIASMTKMMTALIVFEEIEKGEISYDDIIYVSKAASRIGGSQVYLDPKENFTLGELLKTIMISSANDSSYLVAEKIGGGSVPAFVKRMNERAKELGMKSTKFYNPHGLPEKGDKDNKSSAYDLAILACELLKYPVAMKWASTWTDDFRDGKFILVNHFIDFFGHFE